MAAAANVTAPSSAVHRGVADVVAWHDVDDVLGDVGGVVADALEVFGHKDQLEGREDHAGIVHHISAEFTEDLVAVVIDLVLGGENFLREVHVAPNDGVKGVAHHFLSQFAHAREVHIGLHARVAQNSRKIAGFNTY